MININDFKMFSLSVAMTEEVDNQLKEHLYKGPSQEDLAFALWSPSIGNDRFTAILRKVILPEQGDRILQGNVAFTAQYVQRVIEEAGGNYGIALLHSHLGPGWQGMSSDDIVAEKDRLASAVSGSTRLPLVGLTWGTDGSWSGRFWLREAKNLYKGFWAKTVRVIGQNLRITFHPQLMPYIATTSSQVATASVWGDMKQSDLARVHVGIVGLGSVGSIVAEALSRMGVSHITLIDHDVIEERNLDRTVGATIEDALNNTAKVDVSERLIKSTHTANKITVEPVRYSLLVPEGLNQALDCDVIFSCVDRPFPRHMLNTIAYAHLIPIIDGGILARVDKGRILHADWRIHTIGPGKPCMVCLNALKREDISMDKAGLLDDPSYIQGLGSKFSPLLARQNIFPFSLSVASHEVLQFIGLITGEQRIGGTGPQFYHCYPGIMEVLPTKTCEPNCEYSSLTASAHDLSGNLSLCSC